MAPNAAPNEQANISVVMIVVLRSSGLNSSAMLGRFNVPAAFFIAHLGDSGRKGRIRMRGIAGINPLISVYRHAAWDSFTCPKEPSRKPGSWIAGRSIA